MGDLDTALYWKGLLESEKYLASWHERQVQAQVSFWAALRESDVDEIRSRIKWKPNRDYVPDPLAERIAEAYSDLLYGEEPEYVSAEQAIAELQKQKEKITFGSPPPPEGTGVDEASGEELPGEPPEESRVGPDFTQGPIIAETAEKTSDQENLEAIVEANDLGSELREAEAVCVSEGEVWWRIYVDRFQSDYPIIEWNSRSHVRPLFRGRKLIAAAYVQELYREEIGKQWIVWRYVQVHADGIVLNLLYKGDPLYLGTEIDLSSRPETKEMESEWEHDLGMLCGRIPNKLGKDRRYGISEYKKVKELLLSLNEATTIGHENARLTLKRRVVVPQSALQSNSNPDGTQSGPATFDATEDVLVADGDDLDEELGNSRTNSKFTVLEYSFDAQSLIAYKEDLASIILTRCGLAEQFVSGGRGQEGMASSGTALRLRLIPTTMASKGKARFHDSEVPTILMQSQMVDAMPESLGGFERTWNKASEAPVFKRGNPLPEDEAESVNKNAVAVNAEIKSRLSAIKDLNPQYTDEEALAELFQINWELNNLGPLGALNLTTPVPPGAKQPPGPPQPQGTTSGNNLGGTGPSTNKALPGEGGQRPASPGSGTGTSGRGQS